MKFFLILALLVPAMAYSNITRIACHKNSESFFELEYDGSSQGTLIHQELINRRIATVELDVVVSEDKGKITVKSDGKSQNPFTGIQLARPIKLNTFVFTPLQKITQPPQKSAMYGCVMIQKR